MRPPPRDESAVITKQGDEDEGTIEFHVGQCLVGIAVVERKIDAMALQNEKTGLQNQRLATLVLALVAQQLADAAGAGGLAASSAVIAGIILLAVFPQVGGALVGKVPALAALTKPGATPSIRPKAP